MTGWGWLAFASLIALLIVNLWYSVEMIWTLNRKHQREIMELNHEYRTGLEMMRRLRLPDMARGLDDDE